MEGKNTAQKHPQFILVVDSNVDDRFAISMLLQRFGYSICNARGTEEAVEFMHVSLPAAIVSEAGATGSGLLARLRKDARFAEIPLILLSPSPDRALEDRARKGEFAAFLRKPADVEGLYRTVQAAVERTPRRNIRISVSVKARLDGEHAGVEGAVTVLSELGMFFRTLDPPPANTPLSGSIEIQGRNIPFEAVVLYSYTFNEGPFNEPGMGMKFTGIGPSDQALIKAFILERVGEGIPRQAPQGR